MHRFPLLTLIAAASLILGTACDGSSPLAPGENGNTDLPGTGSGFHESGAIQSASPSASDPSGVTIVLGGDVRVQVGDETVIDAGGDLTTLDEVLAAVDAGIPVRIEIDGTITDGVVTATHVRFETDGVGAADDEVHAFVAGVDLAARTVTLADGRAIRIASDALIETDGDFLTLSQVEAALAAGLEVRVEADLGPIGGGVREATSAKFESDQADGPGDDGAGPGGNGDGGNGDDPAPGGEFDEVHGIVAAVDLGARTVTLADGRLFRVADASIETDGDFLTLASVAAALEAGLEVRVKADLGPVGGDVRDATSAKFESDRADGPGDDRGDDNSGPGTGGDEGNSGPGHGGGGEDGKDNSGPGRDDDHDDDDDDFDDDHDFDDDEVEGIVASVDLAARTITTGTAWLIRVESDAMIEADGDILTLAEVATRLTSGAPVRVEADGAMVDGVFVATQAKFEVDD